MNLALFDFDGTITFTNTWTPFLHFAARPSRLMLGRVLLLPVIVGHRIGLVPAAQARQLANCVAFRGERTSVLQQRGSEYANDVLPPTVRQWALDRIEWHKSEGDDVVVVSASLNVYLRPWCEAKSLLYICTTLEERAGRFTGRCVHGDCSGAEKARRIRERFDLSRYPVVYAYGDTLDDRAMLELAHRKYYRGMEVSSWEEVTDYADPPIIATNDANSTGD